MNTNNTTYGHTTTDLAALEKPPFNPLPDLTQVVHRAMVNLASSGKIEAAIETQLTKTVTDLVNNELREYSDFGGQLKEVVKAAIGFDAKTAGHQLPIYNDLILKIVQRQLDGYMQKILAEQTEQTMTGLLAPAPDVISVQALLDAFIEHEGDTDDPDLCGREFTFRIKNERAGFVYIYFDKDENKTEHQCDYRLGFHEGKLFSLTLDGKNMAKELFTGPLYRFERFLFQLYMNKTSLDSASSLNSYDYEACFPGGDY